MPIHLHPVARCSVPFNRIFLLLLLGSLFASPTAFAGTIVIVKNSLGGDGSFDFVTDVPGLETTVQTQDGTGSVSVGDVPAGVYSIVENVPPGWILDSASCDDGSLPDAVDLADDETVSCTFNNITNVADWQVTKYWNRGSLSTVTVTLTCDGIAPVSGIATPNLPLTLTATGWDTGATSCVVTEDVPDGTFEEYSTDCSVDDVVNATTYICDIGNSESFASFAVRKNFADRNDVTPVTLHMDCNDGETAEQQLTVFPVVNDFGQATLEANFEVSKFTPGQMDCTIYEEPVGGYTAFYECGSVNNPDQECTNGENSPLDQFGDGPCYFEDVDSSGAYDSLNFCNIRNVPNPGEVLITKEWSVEGAGGNALKFEARINIESTDFFDGATACNGNKFCGSVIFDDGPDSETRSVTVYPTFKGATILVDETLHDSAFESVNDCGGTVTVYPMGYEGNDGPADCTFTNTAFFKSIPTLNQHGMAILLLLMLGIGMVGFRRFA